VRSARTRTLVFDRRENLTFAACDPRPLREPAVADNVGENRWKSIHLGDLVEEAGAGREWFLLKSDRT
jgi:hypothetical protein